MAVLLSVALFAGWTAVGIAVLNAGRFRGGVRKLLLAPTVGLAAVTVIIFITVQAGLPVARSGHAVGGVLLITTLGVLWRTRVPRQRVAAVARRWAPFAAVLAATFALTAWPLARYGSDWVANGNDDMANYCVGAVGFQTHGYVDVPTFKSMSSDQDLTHQAWFILFDPTGLTRNRCGSELLLALVATWTGWAPQQTFMPVIIALNAALVSATAGLVLQSTRRRTAGVLAAALLAVSSQTGYAVVQQLIAQAGGLALLSTSLALVCSPFRRLTRARIVRRAAVCGLVFTGLIVFYPEAVPFLVGGCVLLGFRDIALWRLDRRHLEHAAAGIAAMAVLAPLYLYDCALFLFKQAVYGGDSQEYTIEIFPYFMTPRGAALVLGLLPTYGAVPEPRKSVAMAAGLVLLAAVVVIAVQQFRRGRPFAAVLLVMSALTVMLYRQQAAFGLFKIAMFAQPFLWATVAAWAASRRRQWATAIVVATLLVAGGLNLKTQYWYVKQSTGHDGCVDLPAVTQQKLMSQFRAEVGPRLASGEMSRVLIASENNILVKLLVAETTTVPSSYLAIAPYEEALTAVMARAVMARGAVHESVGELAAAWQAAPDRKRTVMVDPKTGRPLHELLHQPADWTADPAERVLLVAGCGQLSVLNRLHHRETGPSLLCVPLSEVRNFAVFRNAVAARKSFFGRDKPSEIALSMLEPDPNFPKRSMVGLGRHLVLDVLNPSPNVRVLVDYTASFQARPQCEVPPVHVLGDRRIALGAIGTGSARLVSPPLAPQTIGPSHLLALDFGAEPTRHPNRLSGFEALWGADLPRDRRMLTASARNISVISDEEYAEFRPPAAVEAFPGDLAHPHLEYSGVFESGWVGKEFKFRLTQPETENEVVLRGQIPRVPGAEEFSTELTVLVDGQPVETRALTTGEFEVRAPGTAAGPRWVEYRFSRDQQLPAPDGRRVVALIRSVGFEARDGRKSRPPERLDTFPTDLSHPKLDQSGIFADGWTAPHFRTRLLAAPGRDAVVRGCVPGFTSATFRTEVTLLIDGTEVAKRELGPGDFEIRVPVPNPGTGPRWIECRVSHSQTLPAPDGRAVGVQLKSVGFEAAK